MAMLNLLGAWELRSQSMASRPSFRDWTEQTSFPLGQGRRRLRPGGRECAPPYCQKRVDAGADLSGQVPTQKRFPGTNFVTNQHSTWNIPSVTTYRMCHLGALNSGSYNHDIPKIALFVRPSLTGV